MAFYVQRGRVPKYRHIAQRTEDGRINYEEHVSREGFSDVFANLYHIHMPTAVRKVGAFTPFAIEEAEGPHRHRHFETFKFGPEGDWVHGRKPNCFNNDVIMYTACPDPEAKTDFFYRNARADEVLFVHKGSGALDSTHGRIEFGEWDYVVVPRGILHRVTFDKEETRLFIVESTGPVQIPKQYRNQYGQLVEMAPYSERDFGVPEFVDAVDEKGEFKLLIKIDGGFQELLLDHHPFDVVGWDGFYYPFKFNIRDYMPKVGRVHLPPPVHLTFNAPGYVLCSFCPRLFDWEPDAIPVPYAHSNVDSDEVLYYVDGEFMSRKGIDVGSITLHPYGFPHGPQPGLTEKSIGAKKTEEYAVMVDTFRPLKVAKAAEQIDDPKYPYSWLQD